jgi:hypothetical protein
MKLVSLIIVGILTGWSTTAAFAQSPSPLPPTSSPSPTPLVPLQAPEAGINLTLSPVFINLTTDPGQPVSTRIKITNNNNFREFLRIDVAKFGAGAGGERPAIADLNPEDDFGKWISFSEPQFTVDPRQTKTVKLTISPPDTAALGYYYALIVNRIREKEPGARQTVVTGAPAILTLLEVRSPRAKKELQLVDFKTDKFFYEYLPVEFKVRLKNTGNIHLVPAGDIFIDKGRKKDVAILLANQSRGNILPQSERTFSARWEDGFVVRVPKVEAGKVLKDAKGNTVYTVKWDLTKADRFRLGKYTAHLLMVYDNGERDIPLESTVSFWVVPWKILLGILLGLVLILVGVKATFSSSIGKLKQWRR